MSLAADSRSGFGEPVLCLTLGFSGAKVLTDSDSGWPESVASFDIRLQLMGRRAVGH